MTHLRLNLLGRPRFERDGEPIALTQSKAIALLLYLAVTRHSQLRERMVELLWPESSPQAARKNMRNTLWAIGEALGTDLIEQTDGLLRISPNIAVDVHMLEDALLVLESGSLEVLEAATAHYRGPLADGLAIYEAPDFEIWLLTERERLAALYLRLVEQIIALQRANSAWTAIVDQAQPALAVGPARESIHLALIEAYVRLGQRDQAVQQYTALTTILKHELDVAPLPETTARYHALLADSLLPSTMPVRNQLRLPTATGTPFVGRAQELAMLDQERDRAVQGEARIVLISGDLGMGKTSLWQTWSTRHTNDALILATHALETAEPIPFGPLQTLFRRPGPAHDIITPPSPLSPIWLAELSRLLPEISAAWPNLPPPLEAAEERARLLHALTEAVRLLIRSLLVLIIDDLHWVDPSTLDWLVTLIDQLPTAPLLLIGAYRPQDASERVKSVIASWQRRGHVRQLALPHLSKTESQQLLQSLGGASDSAQVAEWVRQSGGNPYFLTELQRATVTGSGCDIAALVRTRLQTTVPARALQVLQAAAVLGDNATFATLQATSGRSEEETLDALDQLDVAGVLSARDRVYQFVHPLVAALVRMDLSPARRAFLHRRAAEALTRANAAHTAQVAGLLMEHYAEAGDFARAAQYAEQAAEHALQVAAFIEAPAYARRALEWEPTPRRQLLLAEVLMQTSSASTAQTQLEAALHVCEQSNDQIGVTRACLSLALLAISTGQPNLARSWLARQPIQQVQALDPALSVRALQVAAFVERQSRHYPAAEQLLNQAEQIAHQHQLSNLSVQITFERGNLLANRGDLRAAVDCFASALYLAQDSTNPVFTVMAQNNLAYHSLLLGEIERAQQHIERAVTMSEQYALSFLQQFVASTMGEIMLARGELERAAAAFEHAYTAAQTWGNRAQMSNLRVNQARLALAQHDWEQAQALLADAQNTFVETVEPMVQQKIAQLSEELSARQSH